MSAGAENVVYENAKQKGAQYGSLRNTRAHMHEVRTIIADFYLLKPVAQIALYEFYCRFAEVEILS